ncbi:hypothetical protein [Raoultella ornithinolytica]|uniref:hypothetical protein n=1 Tax=Raoultella ornithinolytica TaxID=54291 RepID=UPI0015DC2866|nr:hypothetical protein [Raoultella ornithinolytica]BBQ88707.1 hypothetical protein WP3W18E06_18350 [Raoultella ornithinolytica]
MTTDITELAQREKFEAWFEGAEALPWGYLKNRRTSDSAYQDPDITDMWVAWKAAGAELVEALEKAQQVDEELCKLLPPGAEYMDPPDGGDVTPLEGVRRMVADYRLRIAELESRTVKLPPELYTIGEIIRTQDNRITDQPMFVVFQKREIIGSDEHSPSRICWVWDGEEVSELRAKRLEALYQDGRDTRGYDRYAMQEVDEFVTACFTEHGCKDYLRQNGHNLRLPYIYACGSFRNNEYQLVRNWLAGIKVEGE